ncbi:MAG: hypothetical protein PHN60_03890 [Candidatus Gracilibacteria bacterium]|nr:hypothetical protein [Candidatus Gracilibacteria bacterium]
MKYIILSVLLFGLASCSLSNLSQESSEENTASGTSREGTQNSDSGALTSSGDINGESEDSSGSISEDASETGTVSSESGDIIRDEEDVRIGTGIEKGDKETNDVEKDPEVQSITEDIDKIFSDIENGGK